MNLQKNSLKKLFQIIGLSILSIPLISWTSDPTDPNAITSIPYFEIKEAVSFQDVHHSGDILFIARINLDEDGTFLLNNSPQTASQNFCNLTSSDCSTTPIKASNLTLEKDLYSQLHPLEVRYVECATSTNCQNSPNSQTVVITGIVKRIDHSLISLYKSSQSLSGISYGNPNSYLCLTPNPSVFSANQEKCLQVIQQGTISNIGSFLLNSIRTLEEDLELEEYKLVNSSNKITHEGRDFVELAIPHFSKISKKITTASGDTILQFQVTQAITEETSPSSVGNLYTQLDSEYQATQLDENVNYLMDYTFGLSSGSFFWQFVFLIFSTITLFFFFYITRNGFFSVFSFIAVYSLSIFVVPSNLNIMLSIIALSSLFVGSWLVRRMGQN